MAFPTEKATCMLVSPAVPDDDRARRRLGDATKARIDDLAAGWSVEPDASATTVDPPLAPALPPPLPLPPAPDATPTIVASEARPGIIVAPELPARSRPRTLPPPPPGSLERKAIEQAILDARSPARLPTDTTDEDGGATRVAPDPRNEHSFASPDSSAALAAIGLRPKSPTRPPPPPPPAPPRSKTASSPPADPASIMPPSAAAALAARPRTATLPPLPPPPQVRPKTASMPPLLAPPSNLTGPMQAMPAVATAPVPRGEFDAGDVAADNDAKLRAHYVQATMKRDAAEALLGIPSPPATVVRAPPVELLLVEAADKLVRGDPTTVEGVPRTSPFVRADPTSQQRDDATTIEPPSRLPTVGATLRTSAALRRKRGALGDVRYVFTALFGVRSARRELAASEERQRVRQQSRRRHLTTLGRTAVATDGFDHPALGKAREALALVEDERSKHAGAVAASDAELDRVKRDREATAKASGATIAAADAELAELAKKLEPLERESAAARKQAAALAEQLRKIAKQIADAQARLVSVKGDALDRTSIHADIATLKADQIAVQRDEPTIAAEIDALDPRIAAIRAARAEAEQRKADAQAAEREDVRRTAELYEAIGAKRKVVERAASDAEASRDRALFDLGERLCVDRPLSLAAQLAPIDAIELELGESDRRTMELREILSNVDRMKLARGILLLLLVLGAAGAFVAWLVVMLV